MAKESDASAGDLSGHGPHVRGSEVFVGGLPRAVTESEIREIFSPCGEVVELRLIKDQKGTSKGFCFVRFATKEAASKAHKDKDGIMIQGKKVGVTLSSDKDQLFFGNLRKDWSSEEFEKLVYQAFEDVVAVDLAMLPSLGASPAGKKKLNRGFAYVQFFSHAAAARAFRVGSRTEFVLPGGWHPVIEWAEKKLEHDSEELAKVKVAFIGNLPTNADEDFLSKLFEPLGKIERVALSRKGPVPVGFVHFANHSDLEKAITEMDGKTVQGPLGGPTFKIQVSIAKSVEKGKKRDRDEANKSGRSDSSRNGRIPDHVGPKSKAAKFPDLVVDATDSYEEAVISLPSAIKERLLRIFRLGIATRFDVDVQCISSLKELPESAAIVVLDQFMISGAEKDDKRAYLTSLLSRHQAQKLGASWTSSHIPILGSNFTAKESEPIRLQGQLHPQAIDQLALKYSSYRGSLEPQSSSPPILQCPPVTQPTLRRREHLSLLRDPDSLSSVARLEPQSLSPPILRDPLLPRPTFGRHGRLSLLQDPVSLSSAAGLEPVSWSGLRKVETSLPSYHDPVSQSILRKPSDPISRYQDPLSRSNLRTLEDPSTLYPNPVLRSSLRRSGDAVSSVKDPVSSLDRPQIKFDPFTGQPYKFDPFTGEPIQPEANPPRRSNFF